MSLLANVLVAELAETELLSAPESICQSDVKVFGAEDEALGQVDNLGHYRVLLLVEVVTEVRSLISFFAVGEAAVLAFGGNEVHDFRVGDHVY